MKTEFYAKTDQTYQEHIEAVYRAWGDLLEERMDLLRRLSAQFGFDLERFLKGSLLSVALHDIGKMSIAFQEMLHAKRSGKTAFQQSVTHTNCYPSSVWRGPGSCSMLRRRWRMSPLSLSLSPLTTGRLTQTSAPLRKSPTRRRWRFPGPAGNKLFPSPPTFSGAVAGNCPISNPTQAFPTPGSHCGAS